jgi:hypothetical protein
MLLESDEIMAMLEATCRRAGATAVAACKDAFDAGRVEGLKTAIALVEGLAAKTKAPRILPIAALG